MNQTKMKLREPLAAGLGLLLGMLSSAYSAPLAKTDEVPQAYRITKAVFDQGEQLRGAAGAVQPGAGNLASPSASVASTNKQETKSRAEVFPPQKFHERSGVADINRLGGGLVGGLLLGLTGIVLSAFLFSPVWLKIVGAVVFGGMGLFMGFLLGFLIGDKIINSNASDFSEF